MVNVRQLTFYGLEWNKMLIKTDILCGAVYTSPEGSKYCNLDCFDAVAQSVHLQKDPNIVILIVLMQWCSLYISRRIQIL